MLERQRFLTIRADSAKLFIGKGFCAFDSVPGHKQDLPSRKILVILRRTLSFSLITPIIKIQKVVDDENPTIGLEDSEIGRIRF